MQDKRSRAYDPGSAAQKIEMIKQEQESQAVSAQTRIQEIQANIAMKEAEAYEMLAGQGLNAGGYPFGGRGAGAESVDVSGLAKSVFNDMNSGLDEATYGQVLRLIDLGREKEALTLLAPFVPELAGNPMYAKAPPGINSGEEYVTPDGRIGVAP